ncbi:hypothetical protein GCM10028805_50930 [Spirosoma harenae]
MHTNVNWTSPISWLIAVALVALLLVQIWVIIRNQSLSPIRKWVRGGLNGLLWLLVVGYFLRIQWTVEKPSKHALLVDDDVPSATVRQVKDSLHIQENFTARNVNAKYDSITLLGQRFPTELLAKLSNSHIQWIPYNQADQLHVIHWDGIVRQGEMQRVRGLVQSSKEQSLRLRFGGRTLDSISVHEGHNEFALQFPAFARGRSQVELILGNKLLDTLHFFARPSDPITVQFLLNSPDFESKTLADWFGKQGHTVNLSATLSKNIGSSVSINKGGKAVPDLIVTEPANAANTAIKKAVADGKAVLFINLTNPEADLRTINLALGSRWQVRKVSNEPLIPVSNGLNSLPYRFAETVTQFTVPNYPVAVQRTIGRVGVSLLSETYPLSLSGDSLTYNRLWTSVLARLSSSNLNTVQVDAPVYSGIQQAITINNPSKRLATLKIGQDTLRLTYSPINERSATGQSTFSKSGWQTVQDSLAMYVSPIKADDPTASRVLVSQFMLAHSLAESAAGTIEKATTAQLPDWAWLVLLVACFTALWVEPKV